MKPRKRASLIQHRRSNRFDLRLVLSIVLAIAVLLGQSIPAMADHGSNTSTNWIEICGDNGTYFIEVSQDGQKPAPECIHCDYCLTPVGDAQAVHAPQHSGLASIDFSNISYSTDPASLPDSPEQYWSACRGPPIASIENKMTSNTSLTLKEPIGSAYKARSIPCA